MAFLFYFIFVAINSSKVAFIIFPTGRATMSTECESESESEKEIERETSNTNAYVHIVHEQSEH